MHPRFRSMGPYFFALPYPGLKYGLLVPAWYIAGRIQGGLSAASRWSVLVPIGLAPE